MKKTGDYVAWSLLLQLRKFSLKKEGNWPRYARFLTQSPALCPVQQMPSQVITDSDSWKKMVGSSPYTWSTLFPSHPLPKGKIYKLAFGSNIKNYNLWVKIKYLELLLILGGGWREWRKENMDHIGAGCVVYDLCVQEVEGVLRVLFSGKTKASTTLPGTLFSFDTFASFLWGLQTSTFFLYMNLFFVKLTVSTRWGEYSHLSTVQ